MNEINIKELLDKLITLTKSGKIEWEYLDKNAYICNELNCYGISPSQNHSKFEMLANAVASKKWYDSDNSFYAKINENYVIIYCNLDSNDGEKTLDERLICMLVPRTYKDILRFASDGSEGQLLRLHSLVKSCFPSAKDIVDDILNL